MYTNSHGIIVLCVFATQKLKHSLVKQFKSAGTGSENSEVLSIVALQPRQHWADTIGHHVGHTCMYYNTTRFKSSLYLTQYIRYSEIQAGSVLIPYRGTPCQPTLMLYREIQNMHSWAQIPWCTIPTTGYTVRFYTCTVLSLFTGAPWQPQVILH